MNNHTCRRYLCFAGWALLLPAFEICSPSHLKGNQMQGQVQSTSIDTEYAKSATDPYQISSDAKCSILGKWFLVKSAGRSTVTIVFDSTTLYILASDTIRHQYNLQSDSLKVDEYINGEPTSGIILCLTDSSLIIRWQTGDTSRYSRNWGALIGNFSGCPNGPR